MGWALPIEVLLYGTFWAYLLFLLPAAVVTGLKGRWLLLSAGFFTFGLTWYLGGLERAKDESWWHKRFNATEPDVESREFNQLTYRRTLKVAVISVAAVLLIGLFAARPAPLLGVDGKTLQYEVGGVLSFEESCGKRRDGGWTCFQYDDAVSGSRPYRVSVGRSGCWKAKVPPEDMKSQNQYSNPEDSGCLTIFSYLKPIDLILG